MNFNIKQMAFYVTLNKMKLHNIYANFFVLSGSTAASQIITFSIAPILSRIYTPNDFGIFATYLSVYSILLLLITCRYDLAIPLADNEGEAISLLHLSQGINFLLSAFIIPGVLLFVSLSGLMPRSMMLILKYLYALPVVLLVAGAYQSLAYLAIRKKLFPSIALAKLNQSIANVIFLLILGTLTFGAWGLILADTMGWLIASCILIFFILKNLKSQLYALNINQIFLVGKKYKNFPMINLPSGMLNGLALHLPILFINGLYGARLCGLFMFSQKISRILLALIGMNVSQIFFSEIAHQKDNQKYIKQIYFKFLKNLFLVGIIPYLTILFFGSNIFSFIFGLAWQESGEIAQILSYMFFIEFLISPLSHLLIALEKLNWQLYWDAMRTILLILLFGLAYYFKLEYRLTLFLYGFIFCIAYLILFMLHLKLIMAKK